MSMNIEQVIKQVDWLDDERRKDKTQLSSLQERVIALEESIPKLSNQIKDLSSEINKLSTLLTRVDQIDENLLQGRIDTKHNFDELEKRIQKVNEEGVKLWQSQIGAIDNNIEEIRKDLEEIPHIQKRINNRVEEEIRINRSIEDTRNKIDDIRRSEEEYTRTIRLLDDGRRQDGKKITDLQGELAAIRKLTDEQSGKIELTSVATRKLETRMHEFEVVEGERRDTQEEFLERQAMTQVEREREWKSWQTRFDQIEQQTMDVESTIQNLDKTHRDVKRTQQNVDDLSQKLDRRVNEITEIQRLSEERFRQEWVTFKADDQKRWTNYTLTQDEQHKESIRQHGKIDSKVTDLDDSLQDIKDLVQQTNELEEKRLQSIRALLQDWVTDYERVISSVR